MKTKSSQNTAENFSMRLIPKLLRTVLAPTAFGLFAAGEALAMGYTFTATPNPTTVGIGVTAKACPNLAGTVNLSWAGTGCAGGAINGQVGTLCGGSPAWIQTTQTMNAVGTCTFSFSDNTCGGLGTKTIAVTVNKGSQTIAFTSAAPAAAKFGVGNYTPTATATPSGLGVTLAIDATTAGVCSIAGGVVTWTGGVGNCTIDANQGGNANYFAAPQVQQTFAVGKADQSISFTSAAPAAAVIGAGNYTPTATGGSSGNAVTFTIDAAASTVCSIAGGIVTWNGVSGNCIIDANQAGNANYNAAPQAPQTFVVKASQTITVYAQTAQNFNGGTFAINPLATASSGLAVSYSSTSPAICTVAGTTVTEVSTGTCTLVADQAGNGSWAAAPQVPLSITINKGSQTITVTSLPTNPPATAANGASFPVTATASSGLAVAISVSGTCTYSAPNVTMNANSGICYTYFNQAGNANYNAATQVVESTGATTACTYTGLVNAQYNDYLSAVDGLGHVQLNTSGANPGKTWLVQPAPDNGHGAGFFNIYNQTDGRCLAVGDGGYEMSRGAASSAGYLVGLTTCDYTNDHTQWIIEPNGSGSNIKTNGYVANYTAHCAAQDLAINTATVWVRTGGYCGNSYGRWNFTGGGSTCSAPAAPNHIRFEFNSNNADTVNPLPITIKTCTTAAMAPLGTPNACTDWPGVVTLQPGATKGTWDGLTASPLTTYQSPSSGITLRDATQEATTLSFSNYQVGNSNAPNTGLTSATLECVDTSTNKVVNCTSAFTFVTKPHHYRFEFNPTAGVVYTCQPMPITIKACAQAACTSLSGLAVTLTPTSTAAHASWVGLSALPATTFTGSTSGVMLKDTTVGETSGVLDYINPSVAAVGSATLECYNTATSTGVSCTNNATYADCTFAAVDSYQTVATNQIFTKLAGVPFSINVVGSNATVAVDLVDASSGWDCTKVGTPTSLQSLGSVTLAGGQYVATTTYNDAASSVRVRIVDSNSKCYNSADTFTIRPAELSIILPALSDSNSFIAGQSGDGHATGPTLFASARYGWSGNDSTGTSTSYMSGGYTGTPTVDYLQLHDWKGNALTAAGLITNTIGAGNGGSASGTVFFDDFGPLDFNRVKTVVDKTFAASSGDIAAGDCDSTAGHGYDNTLTSGKYGCWVKSAIPGAYAPWGPATTDRFRPYYYSVISELGTTTGPGAGTCNNITYIGNTFGSSPAGQLTLTARSASGTRMALLDGSSGSTPALPATAPMFYVTPYNTTGNNNMAPVAGLSFTAVPSSASHATSVWTGGQFSKSPTSFRAVKGTTPIGPFDNLVMAVTVSDADSATVASCQDNQVHDGTILPPAAPLSTCVPPCSSANGATCTKLGTASARLRYGILKLDNAYGSELLPLYVTVSARYWNGTAWVPNNLDSCTLIPALSIGIGNYKGNLTTVTPPASPTTLVNGGNALTFKVATPVAGIVGSVDIAINLSNGGSINNCGFQPGGTTGANLPGLQNSWCATGSDPSARITFGVAKSPILFQRERY